MKNNIRIRQELKKKNLKHWELAERLAITEFTLSRWLRNELPDTEQEKIISIIRREE